MKRIAAVLLVQVALGLILSGAVFAQPSLTPTAAEIDQSVSAALRDLYAHNDAARSLGAKAKAVLVFPDIKKGAFIVGAQWGYGALRKGSRTVGYYRTAAASYGFQAGVKKFGYALFFMTDSALAYLDSLEGGQSAPDRA
jgi:lipid-binding SYLF domain-containing protein